MLGKAIDIKKDGGAIEPLVEVYDYIRKRESSLKNDTSLVVNVFLRVYMRNHVKGRAGKEPPTKEERHEIGDEIIPTTRFKLKKSSSLSFGPMSVKLYPFSILPLWLLLQA
jgi:hypothetical protein